jgi:hypothetical protein
MLVAPELVCKDLSFRNAKGKVKKGLRDCTSASLADCTEEGQSNCRATETAKVTIVANLAPKIVTGQTVAGVAGTALVKPADCASDGEVDCVTTSTVKAAPVAGLESKIALGQTVAGIAGTVTPAPAACDTDGQTGCVTSAAFKAAKMVNFTDSDIRTTVQIAGVAGSLTGAPASCAADGDTGCVANASYRAAATAGLASKVLSTTTVAGVTGNVTLPSAASVLASATFGPSGGTSGTINTCAADGSGCYLTAYDGTSNHLKAIDYDFINTNKAKMQTSLTISGIAGTLADCASDGAGACYVDGTTYKALKPASIDGSKMLSSQTLLSVAGTIGNCASSGSQSCYATGTYYAATACASDGASACFVPTYVQTTQPYKAIDYDNIDTNKAKIRTSLTIASLAGTLADCSTNGTTGCVTTATYQSADLTNLAAGNIKRGVSLAGVTGNFPSATSPLPRYSDDGTTANTQADGGITTDLTLFVTQLTSAGSFEFWDETGIRRTGSGDADIVVGNIKDNVIFENFSNLEGTYTGGGSNCTDAGQIGCLTTSTYRSTKNFRNTANRTGIFDNATSPGTSGSLDIYDTIDDYNSNNAGLPADQPWGASYAAGSSYWTAGGTDVTTAGLCNHLDDQCVYTDNITGLMWSEQNANLDFSPYNGNSWPCSSDGCTNTSGNATGDVNEASTYAAGAKMNWWDSVYACTLLNTMNFGGYNTGWRLPTQKELMEANIHGIRSVESANFIQTASANRWSASTLSTGTTLAWDVNLAVGTTSGSSKTNASSGFVCVR